MQFCDAIDKIVYGPSTDMRAFNSKASLTFDLDGHFLHAELSADTHITDFSDAIDWEVEVVSVPATPQNPKEIV